ncbi:MAG: OmpH family outer membrane protein [Proteobacteria bacterium]|nr:OmpH family outer membrane protein [Pseudomonadota bacterium]
MSGLLIAALVMINGQALAADTKIAVIDMKQVLSTSSAGKKAEGVIKQKMDSLQASLKGDQDELIAMQKESEKKGAAWSDSVKREKIAAFQKKRQDFDDKQNNANEEMRKLREQQINPVIKKLEEVVAKLAADNGYAIVLPRNVVLYATDAVDISNTVITELNKVMK